LQSQVSASASGPPDETHRPNCGSWLADSLVLLLGFFSLSYAKVETGKNLKRLENYFRGTDSFATSSMLWQAFSRMTI